MAISVESTSSKIIVTISDNSSGLFILQRANNKNRNWQTLTADGYCFFSEGDEPLLISSGDFIDSYNLEDGLYEYRYVSAEIENPDGKDYQYSKWCRFGNSGAVGYSFNNYTAPSGSWGSAITPDDCRYTFLWGTDFKATNGTYFTDEQIQWFIDESIAYLERELNITIKKRIIMCQDHTGELTQSNKYHKADYDDEESYYRYKESQINRVGQIATNQRPIIRINRCDLISRVGTNVNLLPCVSLDKKKGLIRFTQRPYKQSQTYKGIDSVTMPYGSETRNSYMWYGIDYEAGYENSDYIPEDLRQIIGKVAAISLLNIIGDGLMSGFSSSSLSMDGISESFSSTQSATSAYFGARIQVYKDDVKNYIQENKYKFGFMPIGSL